MESPDPPHVLEGMPVVQWSRIDHRHRVTGACLHFDLGTGVEDPTPAFIAIVAAEGSAFYLMRFTESWKFITDTWHESLEEANRQAEFEYEGVAQTWECAEA